MLRRYTASADTTITNAYKSNLSTRGTGSNMGASDVMDIFSIYGRQSTSSAELSRALIKFPIDGISTDRTNSKIPASGSVDFYLRLYNAPNTRTAPKDAKYVFMMVSQSWQEGVGLDMEGYTDLTLGNEGCDWMTGSNSGATASKATLTALSKTSGQASTRTLVVTDVGGNAVTFTIDNSLSTSTATKIAFGNANSNATQFATNIAAAINAANDAGTLGVTATSSGAVVSLTMTIISINDNTNVAGTAITDSVITATSQWSAATVTHWHDINGTMLAGGSYHTAAAIVNPDVNTEIHIFDQTLSNGTENFEINITPWVEQWIAGTYSNYGIGIMLTSSQEASSSVDALAGYASGRADDDGEMQNPSGSTTSYYIKRLFGRGSQYFFKRPVIEARWDDITRDDRSNFYFSSSLASAEDNLNTIYFYNYVRGRLADIPSTAAEKTRSHIKTIYVSVYSGSVGGDWINGGQVDDVAPSDIPVSGATSANTGSYQFLSADDGEKVRSSYLTVVTGGIVDTGIYSASFAFTGSKNPAVLSTIYDVWFTGSHNTVNASDAIVQYYTGSITPKVLSATPISNKPNYYCKITNLRDKYLNDGTVRLNLYVRDKNWNPTIYTKANSNIENLIIQSASYRVVRIVDNYEAISYGTGSSLYTGLSYDDSGNYFDFDMSLLQPGYEYGFKFSFYDSAVASWIEQDKIFKFRVEDYEY